MKSIEDQFRELTEVNLPNTEYFNPNEILYFKAFFRKVEKFAEELREEGVNTDDLLKNAVAWSNFFDNSSSKFNEILKTIKRSDEETIGVFLTAFLKIEHLINKLLKENEGNLEKKKFEKLMLSSVESKLKKLPIENKTYTHIIPVIQSLKGIRNNLAHDLKFDLQNHEDKVLRKYLNPYFNENKIGKSKLELLIDVAEYVCLLLLLETREFEDEKKKFFSEYPLIISLLGKPNI